MTPCLATPDRADAGLRRAGQLAGLKQGPPGAKSVRPWPVGHGVREKETPADKNLNVDYRQLHDVIIQEFQGPYANAKDPAFPLNEMESDSMSEQTLSLIDLTGWAMT